MIAYRTGWRKTGALSWKMRYRKSCKIGLSMRAMGLAGGPRPSVPTTEHMRKLRATRRALTRTVQVVAFPLLHYLSPNRVPDGASFAVTLTLFATIQSAIS